MSGDVELIQAITGAEIIAEYAAKLWKKQTNPLDVMIVKKLSTIDVLIWMQMNTKHAKPPRSHGTAQIV